MLSFVTPHHTVTYLQISFFGELWRGFTAGAEIQTKMRSRVRNQDDGLRNKQPVGVEHTQLSYLSEKYFHLREEENELVVLF